MAPLFQIGYWINDKVFALPGEKIFELAGRSVLLKSPTVHLARSGNGLQWHAEMDFEVLPSN